jgi:hypothetical protein
MMMIEEYINSKNDPNIFIIVSQEIAASLPFGTKVRGLKPGRSCRIFQGEKILSTSSFVRGSKSLSCPMSQICGMKKNP